MSRHYDVDGDWIEVQTPEEADIDADYYADHIVLRWNQAGAPFVILTKAVVRDLLLDAGRTAGFAAASPSEVTPAQLHGADANDEREGWNLDALTAAVEYGRIAEFSYEKEQSPRTIERRVLKPERIFTTAAGKLCVIGEDQERDDTRVFRIDRIVGHVTVR